MYKNLSIHNLGPLYFIVYGHIVELFQPYASFGHVMENNNSLAMNELITHDVMKEDHDWMKTDFSVEESGGHTIQSPCQPAFTEQVIHFKILPTYN